jgi:protein gp37
MNRVKAGSGWEHLLEIASIEGLDRAYTWNPAVGCHGIGCEVRKRGKCWAEKMAKRFGWSFEPHLIPKRLSEPLKVREPAVITPVSMGDLFGLEVDHVNRILAVTKLAHWHVYAVLTKMPQLASKNFCQQGFFNGNYWFGVTVNDQKDVWRLEILKDIEAEKKYCLFEPLYGPIDYDLSWIDLIVIGGESRAGKVYPPPKDWVDHLVKRAEANNVQVFIKTSLKNALNV